MSDAIVLAAVTLWACCGIMLEIAIRAWGRYHNVHLQADLAFAMILGPFNVVLIGDVRLALEEQG